MPSASHRRTAPAEKPVTLHDIARHLGLSQRTVSQAINGREDSTSKVSEKTRRRVEAAALELGYRPNRAARALRTGKTGLVGVLGFLGLQHHGAVRLHITLMEMRRIGLSPLVYYSSSAPTEIRNACDAMHDAAMDGILVLEPPSTFDEKCLSLLTASGRPVVAVGGTGSEQLRGISRYNFDRPNGFAMLARHLSDEGRRSICFMIEPAHAVRKETKEFIAAINAALAAPRRGKRRVDFRVCEIAYPDRALTIDESPISGIHVLHAPGYLGMRQLIASGQIPDAVMCRSDTMAQGVLLACHEARIAVPERIAVTGFDDEPASSAGWLPLTSVGLPHEEVIRPAVEELDELLKGKRLPREHYSLIPGKIAIRQSTRSTL